MILRLTYVLAQALIPKSPIRKWILGDLEEDREEVTINE
jgi:hypothetical protein